MSERDPITYEGIQALASAFERSADWLLNGKLHGPARTHPLVGIADYQQAATILRTAAFLWARNESEA